MIAIDKQTNIDVYIEEALSKLHNPSSLPQFKIRKEAMCGLAMIYKKHLNNPDVPPATRHAVTWIKDKILHGYYMTSMDDRCAGWLCTVVR